MSTFLGLFNQKEDSKARQMYEDNSLELMRHATDGAITFISGKVHAEMRKTTIYGVDIKTNSSATILEAQCECPVGMGPGAHCKHVQVVLYALYNKDAGIKTRETCTQQLQSFHHVKPYTGSPKKTSSLVLGQSGPKHSLPAFDPRPTKMRKTRVYQHHFRGVWLNNSSPNLPIRQSFPPANIWGVCHDHMYGKMSQEELFLDAMKLINVSADQRLKTEKETRGQNSIAWKLQRECRVTASNFGKICKATSRTDFDALARKLTNQKDFTCPAIDHGRRFESEAKQAFERKTDFKVVESGLWIHPTKPFVAASPDGLVEEDSVLEVKCSFTAKDSTVNADTVKYLQKNVSELHLDTGHDYYYQIQGQMLCTGRKQCYFFVWSPHGHHLPSIIRDYDFISNMLVKLSNFYNQHFLPVLLDKHFHRGTK